MSSVSRGGRSGPLGSWACRSWVRCACPAASPDARNGWYFEYTSNREEAAFLASIVELSRRVHYVRNPWRLGYSQICCTAASLGTMVLRPTAGAATMQACDFAVRAAGRVGSRHLVRLVGEHSGPSPLTFRKMELRDDPAPLIRPPADATACLSVSQPDQRLSMPHGSACANTSARRRWTV